MTTHLRFRIVPLMVQTVTWSTDAWTGLVAHKTKAGGVIQGLQPLPEVYAASPA